MYLNVLSLHFASEGLQLAFLDSRAGGRRGDRRARSRRSRKRFFEDELNVAEGAIERLAPAEIAGGAIGLIVGLGIALLIKIDSLRVQSPFAGRAGSYVAIVLYFIVAIFCAYLGRARRRENASAAVPAQPQRRCERTASRSSTRRSSSTAASSKSSQSGFLGRPARRAAFRAARAAGDRRFARSDQTHARTARTRRAQPPARIGALDISERDYDDLPRRKRRRRSSCGSRRNSNGKLVTNDYNLNRVAHVEGVDVLNINELAECRQAGRAAGRRAARASHSRRKRTASRRRLPGRRHDDRRRARTPPHRRSDGRRRDERAANRRGPHDLREAQREAYNSRMIWGAIIVAAGRGTRFGRPKQFVEVGGLADGRLVVAHLRRDAGGRARLVDRDGRRVDRADARACRATRAGSAGRRRCRR